MANKETRLPDPLAQELDQAIGDLEEAMNHLEEEDMTKAALRVGIAIGRMQSLVERRLAERKPGAG